MRRFVPLVIVLLFASDATAQDAFEQQRAAALAAMTGVDPVYLTFLDGRSTYRIGERIPLRVEFTPVGSGGVVYQECPGAGLQFVFDRRDGTRDPRADRWHLGETDALCGVVGCVYGGVALPFGTGVLGIDEVYDTPIFPILVAEGMELTLEARFDVPGRYRFYVRSTFDTPQSYDTPPRLSNILTVDIVARDPAWEAGLLAQLASELASGDDLRRYDALGALALLGNEAAVDLASRQPGTALTGMAWPARNRRHVVARMLEQIDDVTKPVDWPFLWTLAAVDATPPGQPPAARADIEDRLQRHSARRLKALAAAGRLDAALAAEFTAATAKPDEFSRVMWELPAAGFVAVAGPVARAVLALTPEAQRRLLVDRDAWREFVDPVFLPMFRQLAESPAEGGAQDLAWAMWRRFDPAAADAFARREVVRAESRLGASGLPGLTLRATSRLDEALAHRLETATTPAQSERAASLIERFATAGIRARVGAVLASSPVAATCPVGPLLLAYLFRVDADLAARHVDDVRYTLYERRDPCDRRGVLRAVGDREWTPALARVAVARLTGGSAARAIDATKALEHHGGADAKDALLFALDEWHRAWSTPTAARSDAADAAAKDWANEVIRVLAEALDDGAAWRLTAAEGHRIETGFLDDRDADRWQGRWRQDGRTAEIRAIPSPQPGLPPQFFVGSTWVTGVDALVAHIGLWPAGTSWTWRAYPDARLSFWIPFPRQPSSLWLPGDEAAHFVRAQATARRLGMTLARR